MQLSLGLLPLLALVASPSTKPILGQTAFGTWSNPKGTLSVRTSACAGGLCGAIVWANGKALADARQAGIPHLIGTQLLQNYHHTAHGIWKGRVYVPDMGHSFPSRIFQNGPNQLTISGCLVGGLLCRSQVWRRLD